jgi:hypothetical protein
MVEDVKSKWAKALRLASLRPTVANRRSTANHSISLQYSRVLQNGQAWQIAANCHSLRSIATIEQIVKGVSRIDSMTGDVLLSFISLSMELGK